ncbi:MAG: PASTA domain-containing protein [Chloroflexales bacterium]|nr:PASTA domain-containing protein [Chloroflexales bacterium]
MDFIGGALPNVMFLVGIITFGVGLGLEFKIIEVKNGLSRGGRIGASLMGIVLMMASVALYLRPATPTAASAFVVSTATGTPALTPSVAAVAVAGSSTATATPSATEAPSATAVPSPTSEPSATAAAEPSATLEPTPTVAPSATTAPTSAPTETPLVIVPDLSGLEPKKAADQLQQLGLQLGEQRETCADVGAGDSEPAKVRRDRIVCQSVAPGASAPIQTAIDYALSNEKGN